MKKNLKIQGFVLIGIICSVIFAIGFFRLFYEYRNTIIAQQQKQLLNMVKTTATSAMHYFEKEKEMLDMFAQSQSFKDSWQFYTKTGNSDIINTQAKSLIDFNRYRRSAIIIYDKDFNIITKSDNGKANLALKEEFSPEGLQDMTYNKILGAYQTVDDTFLLAIGQRLHSDGLHIGYGVMFVDLQYFYNEMLAHIKADDQGYVMVKDNSGIILMHPVKGEIGLHAIEGRKAKYPDVDFSEMAKLIDKELKGEEGVFEFSSFWFSENSQPIKAKKFSSFTPIYINEDTFWIFGMNMDYNSFTAPFIRTLTGVIALVALIIIVISTVIFIFVSFKTRQNELVKETAYLKEINSTLDKLHKNEVAMHHAQKLQTIGTMTGGIAHEFNNILTPILGYSQLLMEQLPKESESYSDSKEIFEAANRAKELVGQISSLSRKDSQSTHFRNIDVCEAVREAVKTIELIKPANVNISKNIYKEPVIICGNKTQLHQVMVNLCTNAFHAMEGMGGKLDINVSATKIADIKDIAQNIIGEDILKISISDNGIGIDEEEIANIFTPFYTTKSVGEGTGLGLPFVEKSIVNHGGIVVVNSTKGKGTEFVIYLPFNPKLKLAVDPNTEKAENSLKTTGKRLLIIDDNLQSLRFLKRKLESDGHIPVEYSSPKQALDEVLDDAYEIDTAILDYNMPQFNGVEVARQLKLTNPHINVIIVSGYIKSEILDAKEQGLIDSYITKPINIDKLEKLI